MPRKGRQVPAKEDREPRTKAMSVYFSDEEMKTLEDLALSFGFKSKSAMVVYIMEHLMKGGFSGLTFMKLGMDFADIIEESGAGYIDIPLPKFLKDRRFAYLDAKKAKLHERRRLEREKNERNVD